MQSPDALLTLLRQKLMEQTKSPFRLFQMVDMDGDGVVSIPDFIKYCDRFSLPPNLLTEEQIRLWFTAYANSGSFHQNPRHSADPVLDYSSFKYLVEDSLKTQIVTQSEVDMVTVDVVRCALVQLMHRLGYPIHTFYRLCAYGSDLLYQHHLRNILDTRCNLQFSNGGWDSLWARLKSDSRIQHMTLQEFEVLLHGKPPIRVVTDDEGSEVEVDNNVRPPRQRSVTLDKEKSNTEIVFSEDSEYNKQQHKLTHSTRVSSNASAVMTYLADKLSTVSAPRTLFGKIDKRRYNYLTVVDFASAIKELANVTLTEDLTRDIFQIVAEQANDGTDSELMSYKGFLKLLSCQEYLVPVRVPDKENSTAAMYGKKPIAPFIEGALQRPMYGRRLTITAPGAEENAEASLSGAYSPNASIVQSKTPAKRIEKVGLSARAKPRPQATAAKEITDDTNDIPYPISVAKSKRPLSANSCVIAAAPFPNAKTGDDQRYTTTSLNSLPLIALEQQRATQEHEFITTGTQIQTQLNHAECTAFMQKVIRQLKLRGESLRTMLSETFHNRKVISAKELLWFFRNKFGVAVSPVTILQTFKIGGNDTIAIEAILKEVRVRPSSAAPTMSAAGTAGHPMGRMVR